MRDKPVYKISDDIPKTNLKKDDVCFVSGVKKDTIVVIRTSDNRVESIGSKYLHLLVEL